MTDDINGLVVLGKKLVVIGAKTATEMAHIASLQQRVRVIFAK